MHYLVAIMLKEEKQIRLLVSMLMNKKIRRNQMIKLMMRGRKKVSLEKRRDAFHVVVKRRRRRNNGIRMKLHWQIYMITWIGTVMKLFHTRWESRSLMTLSKRTTLKRNIKLS